MKKTGVYMWTAIMSTFLKYYDTKELAEKIVDLADVGDKDFQINEVRRTSIIFKKRRDCSISDSDVAKLIRKAIVKMIDSDRSTFETELNDRYEFDFEDATIDSDFVDELFTITENPKNIFVEIDLG